MSALTCFKAYDIRGQLGEELNEDIAYRIGRAYGEYLKPQRVIVGGDVRLTSESLKVALANGLQDAGVDVYDIGMSGTEEVYFATFHLNMDGGIEVTASHNPMNYNGMKLVKANAQPISGDTGLFAIKKLAEENTFPAVVKDKRGSYQQISILTDYVDHLLKYIDATALKPMKLVINSGNGAAGHVIDEIERRFQQENIPVTFVKVHHQPDGNFLTVSLTRYYLNVGMTQQKPCLSIRRIWELLLTVISIVVSCLMRRALSSRATISLAYWQKLSCKPTLAPRLFMILVCHGIPSISLPKLVASLLCPKRGMPLSRSACAKKMLSMVAR